MKWSTAETEAKEEFLWSRFHIGGVLPAGRKTACEICCMTRNCSESDNETV